MAVLDCLSEPPFFAPSLQLPATLPSPEDIESCNKVIKEGDGRRIIQIGEHFIVKYGTRVSVIEGQNLLYVKKTKAVPIPEVYALYTKLSPKGRMVTYIIMEYIRGETLETAWPKLSPDEKHNVALELRGYFDKLRKNAPLSRSSRTEYEFNQGLVKMYLDNNGTEENARFYECMLSEVLKDHRPVLTHADLQKDNIILKKDKSLVVIDWEAAGWYPEYWESFAANLAAKLGDDFWNYLIVLDEYPTECARLSPMIQELW
ncbi:hypothetical protein MY3296_006739 [Beauveria thailandica]